MQTLMSPKHIYMTKYNWYVARKWPCPTGFHIPADWEFEAIIDIIKNTLSLANTAYSQYLLMPWCYYLNRSTWAINTSYGTHRYWTARMTNNTTAYAFQITENDVAKVDTDKPANWFNIRPFKDEPVAPDENRTTLYSGYIYHNSTLWLISIKNWDEWITIADKNVWATEVYNPNGSVTANNAWLMFQYGNNYWFPHTWASEFYTSTRTVGSYSWENPYNNEHFVKVSTNNWFTWTNNNLWGRLVEPYESLNASGVYIWTTQVWIP